VETGLLITPSIGDDEVNLGKCLEKLTGIAMSSSKQKAAARRNVKKAAAGAPGPKIN